jgi:hypothetical protein
MAETEYLEGTKMTRDDLADLLVNGPTTFAGLAEMLVRYEDTNYARWYDLFYDHAWFHGLRYDRDYINGRITYYKEKAEKKLKKQIQFVKDERYYWERR